MAKGEFENREAEEAQGLGDLPYPLARERGEAGIIEDEYSNVPPDMRRSESLKRMADGTGLGAPKMDFNVRSVFDSRPVNGFDFVQSAVMEFTFDACSGIIIDTDNGALFRVPFGRVAVIRSVEFGSISTDADGGAMISNNAAFDVQVQLVRNGANTLPIDMSPAATPAGAVYKQGIPIKAPYSFDTFQIVDELETFGLNILVYSTASLDNGTWYLPVKFFGNLLIKTGVPSNFEIANAGPGGKAEAVASSRDVYSTPTVGQRGPGARKFVRR